MTPQHAVRSPTVAARYGFIVGGTGLIAALLSGMLLVLDERHSEWNLILCAAVFMFAALVPGIEVQRGRRYTVHRFWEVAATACAFFSPEYLIPFVIAIGCGVRFLKPFLYSSASRHNIPFVFGNTVLGYTIFAFVAPTNSPWSLIIGVLLAHLFMETNAMTRDWLSGTENVRDNFFGGFLGRMGLPLFFSSLTIAAVYVVATQSGSNVAAASVLPLVALLVYWLGKFASQVWGERDMWRKLQSVTQTFNQRIKETELIDYSLRKATEIFQADACVVSIYSGSSGTVWQYVPGRKYPELIHAGTHWECDLAFEKATNAHRKHRKAQIKYNNTVMGNFGLMWENIPDHVSERNLLWVFTNAFAASLKSSRDTASVTAQVTEKEYEARHDPLTGLGNRAMLFQTGASVVKPDNLCALLLIDLDGFKGINDTLGHIAGDKVLVEVSRRLQTVTRKSDLVIRLGGDEFAILADNLKSEEDVHSITAKISGAIARPIDMDGINLTVEGSIGVSLNPQDATSIEDLYRTADIAMYQAKKSGANYQMYTFALESTNTETLQLATDLREALRKQELELYYQPQILAQTGEVVGMEALVRWNHPGYDRPLTPDKFIYLAEQSARIRQFTLYIIDHALRDRALMRDHLPHASISVNLSGKNLRDQSFPVKVAELLEKNGIPARELVLEIVETSSPDELAAAGPVLEELSALGCQISMDDFMTGYSTINALSSIRTLNEIKIDKSFVEKILESNFHYLTVEWIIDIAREKGCRVVAEGVETHDLLNELKKLRCDMAQGYLIARPMPFSDLSDWIGMKRQLT